MIVFDLICITLCPFKLCNHFGEEKKAGCFAVIVLQMSCHCKCSVALPHGAMGWSAVCDYGISCSYSLTFRCKLFSFIHVLCCSEESAGTAMRSRFVSSLDLWHKYCGNLWHPNSNKVHSLVSVK